LDAEDALRVRRSVVRIAPIAAARHLDISSAGFVRRLSLMMAGAEEDHLRGTGQFNN
jgi:hypothetical protein